MEQPEGVGKGAAGSQFGGVVLEKALTAQAGGLCVDFLICSSAFCWALHYCL